MTTATVVLITLVVYKVVLVGIGLWVARRNRDDADYLLAGRNLGSFVAALSYAASTSSAWVLLGFSGFVYAVGASAVWMMLGIWAGYAVVWLYFGGRLRRESLQHDQLTATDFMLQEGGAGRAAAAGVAGLLILVCFVFYIAAQFSAAGAALTAHFAIGPEVAVLIGAGIVVLYALLGGFWAVSITDALQAVVMFLASLCVPVGAVIAAGGPAAIVDVLRQEMPGSYLSISAGFSPLILVGFVVGTVGMSLGALGQPHLLARLMAVKGERERIQGFTVAISWSVVVLLGMFALGLAGRAILPTLESGEALFYTAAAEFLPAILAGIVIAATLSAVMSTVDSILIAASGAVAHDMGVSQRWPKRKLLVARTSMLVVAAGAVVLTLTLPDTIFNRVLFAWSALGAAFGPIVLWRVMGRQVQPDGALVSMLLGFATTVLFYSLGAAPPTDNLLSVAAHLPGDPFERVFPWLPALCVLFVSANRHQTRGSVA